ncbi:uL15 family ribosomal protein [Patescibacteria group bacterium]|nr:uL15 family ribosomal protein [Patescibacteria group bacterium]
MVTLSSLPKTVAKSQKRVGRGYGSGVGGHTTGRGAKGDKVRGTNKLTFDGSKIKKSWIKRTPFLRGKHRILAKVKPFAVSLTQIDVWFKANDTITVKDLQKKLHENYTAFKILSAPKFDKTLTFKGLVVSTKAKDQIIAAGGKIES